MEQDTKKVLLPDSSERWKELRKKLEGVVPQYFRTEPACVPWADFTDAVILAYEAGAAEAYGVSLDLQLGKAPPSAYARVREIVEIMAHAQLAGGAK